MAGDDEGETVEAPTLALPRRTVIQEAGKSPVVEFDGVLLLPVGSHVEFDNERSSERAHLDPARFPMGKAVGEVVKVTLDLVRVHGERVVLDVELRAPGADL